MKDVIILFLLLVSLLTFNCTRQDFSESITISKVNRDIRIDGFLKDKVWSSIDSIQGLNAPWTLKCFDQTTFKCFYTENLFCFSFNVVDETIITYDFEDELTVAKGDRVELFFSASSDLKQYYCVEIDPIGNILDYSTQYYRKFDEDWDFNQLIVATQYTSQGYVVEGCISLSELKQLGIEDSFYLGVFRADFRSEKMDDVVWYSWIEPKSIKPDFHIPSAFGNCHFVK